MNVPEANAGWQAGMRTLGVSPAWCFPGFGICGLVLDINPGTLTDVIILDLSPSPSRLLLRVFPLPWTVSGQPLSLSSLLFKPGSFYAKFQLSHASADQPIRDGLHFFHIFVFFFYLQHIFLVLNWDLHLFSHGSSVLACCPLSTVPVTACGRFIIVFQIPGLLIPTLPPPNLVMLLVLQTVVSVS